MRRRGSFGFLWVVFLVFANDSFAQRIIPHNQLPTPAYYLFPESARPDTANREMIIRKLARADNQSAWQVYSRLTDDLGQTHLRLQHFFRGIPVELSTAISHEQAGFIVSVNGDFVPGNRLKGDLKLSAAEAVKTALDSFPSELYYWQSDEQNKMLRYATGNPDTSFYPAPILVYCPAGFNLSSDHRLVYKFNIYSEKPLFGKTVYIDAETGELLAVNELILHTEVTGTAVTRYSSSRSIQTDSTAPGNYRLREAGRGKGIETFNLKNGSSYGAAVDFTDADNYWNNANAQKDEVATDAHWGAEMTYDYFKTEHNRNSFDNNGAKILSYVHYGSNYNNAFWDGVRMTYGDGNGSVFTPLTGLDVCGHEIAHAVTTYTANLVYSYESGALNESFSDIFGNTIEAWARPNQWNWRIGEEITPSKNGIRSMLNPNLFNHPKFYKGVSWYFGAGDNGGVHYNSGVQNYWYYLIANGAKGTNEKGWSFTIDSLGFDRAGKIAYRNLSVYLTRNSQYADARTYSIMAAADLYGQCSKEVIMVTNAWWACGVGAKYDSGFVKADFIGDTLACYTGKSVSFSNLSTSFKSCKWSFGDGNSSTAVNATHAYSNFGNYSVKLVAYSCFSNKSDSITKINYVQVDSTRDICNAAIMPMKGTDSVVRCVGFIYDDGGEANYGALKQVNLKVKVPNADSIRFRFLVLDYENGYDSIVLFRNDIAWSNKIGRFTGNILPYAGKWQTINGNALWIRQYSDPLVEGKGFKIQFEGFRQPLSLNLGNDTTICLGDTLDVRPAISGGYDPHFLYRWRHGEISRNVRVYPVMQTKYYLNLTDACTLKSATDSILVSVRSPLQVFLPNDTIICQGNSVQLTAGSAGGLSSAYSYKWNQGLGNSAGHLVAPKSTTVYNVVLSDGCTLLNDTAEMTVFVKPALQVKISPDVTPVCIGKSVNMSVTGSGGDTAGYLFTWNNGLGTGTSKSVTLTDTISYIVTLTDGCSVSPAIDTVNLFTHPSLKLSISSDTLICRGSAVDLASYLSGGKGTGYSYQWKHGKTANLISETPLADSWYIVTGSDNCSPTVTDSVKVSLMAPLQLGKVSDTTLCDGQSLSVNLTATGGKSSSYSVSWSPGSVSGFNPVLSPAPGMTQYMAILTDGCTVKNDTSRFKITKLNPLAATFRAVPAVICFGDSTRLQISVSGGNASTRTWTVDGVTAAWTLKADRPLADKTYTLNLSDGCSVPITVNTAVSISPAASATLAADKKQICVRDGVQFSYTSPDAAKMVWYFGKNDSAVGTGTSVLRTYPMSGKYPVFARITNSAGCTAIVPMSDSIEVVNYPKAIFTANPDVTNIEKPLVDFIDNSTGGTTYNWNFGDGNTSNQQGSVSHSYSDTGWFSVSLAVTVAPGCTDVAVRKVRIKDVYRLYVPTGFTPDENGLNDGLQIKGRGVARFEIKIYDRWGSRVFQSDDISKSWNGKGPDGVDVPHGMYIWRITTIDTEGYRHEEKGTLFLLR